MNRENAVNMASDFFAGEKSGFRLYNRGEMAYYEKM